MSTFLTRMTAAGHDLVARTRKVKTAEDARVLIAHYLVVGDPMATGRTFLSDADRFAFACALAEYVSPNARHRALHWEAAAITALKAKAYDEGLTALMQAEESVASKERRERIRLLQRLLAARRGTPDEDNALETTATDRRTRREGVGHCLRLPAQR